MILNESKKNNIATIMIVVFNSILFLRQYMSNNQYQSNIFSIVALFWGLVIMIYTFIFKYEKRKFRNIFIFFLFFYLSGIISSIFNSNYKIQDYIIPFQYFGIGICMLSFKLNDKIVKYSFYSLIIFFIINIILGADPTKLFDISRNYISVVLLIFLILYYISCIQNEIRVSIFPTILCFLISLWAVGRSGILTFAILLVLLYFYNNFYPKFDCKKFILQTSVIILIGAIVSYFLYSTFISNAVSRFNNQGMDSGGRDIIWNEYFTHIKYSVSSFIFGVSSQETEILKSLKGNPHNAFFSLHMNYGIFGFLLTIFIIVYRLFYLYKRNLLYDILLFVILIRIFFDSGAFNGPYDSFLYYFLFVKVSKLESNKKNLCISIKHSLEM